MFLRESRQKFGDKAVSETDRGHTVYVTVCAEMEANQREVYSQGPEGARAGSQHTQNFVHCEEL